MIEKITTASGFIGILVGATLLGTLFGYGVGLGVCCISLGMITVVRSKV